MNTDQIKRYEQRTWPGDQYNAPWSDMEESPEGEWVRWEEVKEAWEFYQNRRVDKSAHQVLMEELVEKGEI